MQKLFSFKSISKATRNFSNCSKYSPSLSRAYPLHSPSCPLHQQNHFFSGLATSSHLWRSPNFFLQKVYGFLSNPVLVEQLLPNLILKKGLSNCRVGFIGAQLPRRNFDFKPPFLFHRRGWQSWRQRLTSDNVVLGLILTNVAVSMLWRVADRNFMMKNFTISVDNFKSGRVHTMITSAFSHIEVGHLMSNMIGLYFFGTSIGSAFGPEYLLKLYLSGAIVGSIFYLVHHAFTSTISKGQGIGSMDPSRIPGLGASGAVNAVMLLNIFLFPKATLYVDFIIPVPAVLLGIFLVGKDMLSILEGDPHISGSAHLGGAVVAAIAWARIRGGYF